MTLQELLAQADAPDTLEFKDDKGNVFKLGDVRLFKSGMESEKGKATAEQKRAEGIAKEAEGLLAGLKTAMEDVEKQRAIEAGEKAPKKSDWRKNPLYEEIVPVVEALELQAKEARELAATVKKSLDMSQGIYALERMRRQWAEATVKPKDKKFEDVVQEVLARKDVDAMGLPTLETYLHSATEPDRIQAQVQAALDKNNKEWEQKMRMAGGGGKPGGGAKFSTRKASEPPIKNLAELDSAAIAKAAAEDPAFAKAMEGEEYVQ